MKKVWTFLMMCLIVTLSMSAKAEEVKNDAGKVAQQMEAVATDGVNQNLVYVTDKLEGAFSVLATKLGVAGDKVWSILVYKHTVSGYAWLVLILFTFIMWIATFMLHKYYYKIAEAHDKARTDRYENTYFDKYEGVITSQIIMAVVSLILFAICCIVSYSGFMDLLAPEVGAMSDVMDILKSAVN